MHGYLVSITGESLGSASPKEVLVYVAADHENQALALVTASLGLDDQVVGIVRLLRAAECEALGLKLYQVKHA
jgi:hypothetical protein